MPSVSGPCDRCKQIKPIAAKGLCLSCLAKPKLPNITDIEPVKVESAAPSIINAVAPPMVKPASLAIDQLIKPTNNGGKVPCDICEGLFPSLIKHGKLNLCKDCLKLEREVVIPASSTVIPEYDPKNFKTWPLCKSCQNHVGKEQFEKYDGMCSTCLKKTNKIEPLILNAQPTDSNKYQEFFNQESQAITDLLKEHGEEAGILLLRQIIIDGAEDLLSKEAAAFKSKTHQQARTIRYNDMLSRLSEDKQNELRIKDQHYVPKSGEPRKHKSPMTQIEKVKKLTKSMDEKINSLFGGGLSAAEIEEKKKALGL